jgi:hypothetical protein
MKSYCDPSMWGIELTIVQGDYHHVSLGTRVPGTTGHCSIHGIFDGARTACRWLLLPLYLALLAFLARPPLQIPFQTAYIEPIRRIFNFGPFAIP